jgi:hypothetical protein
MCTPLNYSSSYSHTVFLDDFDLHRIETTINPDFNLDCYHPLGSPNYVVTASINNVPEGSGFWWEVNEVDINTGNIIPNTTLTNPSSWWDETLKLNNSFPGYCCQTNVISGNGTFLYGHKYKITRGAWGPCSSWHSTTKYVYMGPDPKNGQEIKLIENTDEALNGPFDNTIAILPNPVKDICQIFIHDTENERFEISLYSLGGALLINSQTVNSNEFNEFNFSMLTPGIYILKAKSQNRLYNEKILIH